MKTDTIFDGLNPMQKEAVQTLEGPLLILAGAGSGKTKTLTHRIANLIQNGVNEGEILAVTFTNKAAREMRERLWKILAESRGISLDENGDGFVNLPRNFMPYMGTFHGICVRILKIEYEAAGLDRNFTIYDTEDQIALIRRIMKSLHVEDKSLKPKSILSMISKAKNEGVGPEEFWTHAYYPNQKTVAKVYTTYEKEKEAAAALDFDDLLLRALKLFRENVNIREKWRERFKYVLIDEYQDTNNVQYKLIKLLVNESNNICVVGDDWQSIYSWRETDYRDIATLLKAVRILKKAGVVVELVRTHGGVPLYELKRLCKWADVFVACGRCEPWGMRVNDAIHAGLPVIVSDGMGAKMIVEQYSCGIVYRADDARALSDALYRFAKDSALAANCLEGVVAAHEAWLPAIKAKMFIKLISS